MDQASTRQSDPKLVSALSHWAPRLVANGIPLADFEDVTRGIGSWDQWCSAWCKRAQQHEALGDDAFQRDYYLTAGEHYSTAAVCYHFAKFLFMHDYSSLTEAHERAIICRRKSLSLLSPPGEYVSIPFENSSLSAIWRQAHRPAKGNVTPIVIMVMGLDSAKEEMRSYEDILLARGVSTLAFDGPGQGEGEYEYGLRPDYEVAVRAVVDWVERRLTTRQIGLWGVSLGGYFAARSAAFERRIKACVTLSGPYDLGACWNDLPPLTQTAFRIRSKCDSEAAARRHAEQFTLAGVAERINCPTFTVAGMQDRIFPWEQAQRFADEVSTPSELMLIPDGNHVANNRGYRYRYRTADWLADQLGA